MKFHYKRSFRPRLWFSHANRCENLSFICLLSNQIDISNHPRKEKRKSQVEDVSSQTSTTCSKIQLAHLSSTLFLQPASFLCRLKFRHSETFLLFPGPRLAKVSEKLHKETKFIPEYLCFKRFFDIMNFFINGSTMFDEFLFFVVGRNNLSFNSFKIRYLG